MLARSTLQRGLTLIELMVSVAVGFVVMMLLTQFFVGQMTGNSDLLKATRLNQELRAIMDLIERDIRRGGYWANAIKGVYYDGTTGVTTNPLQSISVGGTVNPSVLTTGSTFGYSYDVNGGGTLGDDENFTIQLNDTTHAVELVQGINSPVTTPLSDTGTTRITALTFVLSPAALTISCIAAGSNPTLTVRELTITLTGQLANDSSVTRTLQQTVRIRADHVTGTCPSVIS